MSIEVISPEQAKKHWPTTEKLIEKIVECIDERIIGAFRSGLNKVEYIAIQSTHGPAIVAAYKLYKEAGWETEFIVDYAGVVIGLEVSIPQTAKEVQTP